MSEIEEIVTSVYDALRAIPDVRIVRAYPGEKLKRSSVPVIAVGLKSGEQVTSGMCEYMGVHYDAQTDVYSEIYGKKLTLTLEVDIYCPADSDSGVCYSLFSQAAERIGYAGMGMRINEVSCGEIEFDAGVGMYKCPSKIQLYVYLYAVKSDDEEVLDFTMRGEIRK